MLSPCIRKFTIRKSTALSTTNSVRSKERMGTDKCPSAIILGQKISALLRHRFGEVHCATVDVPQQMCRSKCATADVPQ